MNGTTELKTERLFLRRYRMEDAKILYEAFGRDPLMFKYSGWNPYTSYEMAQETIRKFIRNYERSDFYGWAIEYRGTLIGTIGAYDHDTEKNTIETGMSVAREYWGHGFATEALVCVLEYLTVHEGFHTVTAWCAAENIGSAKALQKAGMRLTETVQNGLDVGGKKYDQQFFIYTYEE